MSGNKEIQTYFGRCRCCLSFGYLKNMWTEHDCEGEVEIYGEMLAHCFALAFEQSKDAGEEDQICESCVERLRDANSFKKQVLEAQDTLVNQMEEDEPLIKIEEDEHKEIVIIEPDELEVQIEDTEHFLDDSDQNEDPIEYEDCVFLEENLDSEEETEEKVKVTPETITEPNTSSNTDPEIPKKKPKWPKKLPRNERLKTYKQYTTESLRQCLEAVSSEEMTRFEASAVYNIPIKTITAKMRQLRDAQTDTTTVKTEIKGNRGKTRLTQFKNNEYAINKIKKVKIEKPVIKTEITADIKPEIDVEQVRAKYKAIVNAKFEKTNIESDANEMTKHRENINNILKYSNATMIKGYWGTGYSCYHCSEQRSDPSELKQHNLESHSNVGDAIIKAKYVSDLVLRIDITGLQCSKCKTNFDDLSDFTSHLSLKHSVTIHKDIKNHVIPFKFDRNVLKCVVCSKEYKYFKLLSEHMSEHYRNYECPVCDRAFINKQSMQTHSYRHKRGVFKCSHCPKVFDTRPKKSVHERIVHALSNKTRKCSVCDARFSTKDLVQSHEVKVHGAKPVVFNCEACNKSYNSHSSLVTHRKRFHLMLRPHKCLYCDMAFFSQIELKSHTVTHTKTREFKCEICSKCFGTRCSLNQHVRGHLDDRRFKCESCDRAFVHRTAWKVHMRSKHGKIV